MLKQFTKTNSQDFEAILKSAPWAKISPLTPHDEADLSAPSDFENARTVVPSHNFVAGQRGSLGSDSPSAGLYLWQPWALRLSPSLPAAYEQGGCPLWHCPSPLPCPGGIFGAPGPDPWVARAQYTIPVPWTLGLLWPTTSVPGMPTTRYSTSQATLPAGQFYSCTPPNGYRAFTQHQQQNDHPFCKFI